MSLVILKIAKSWTEYRVKKIFFDVMNFITQKNNYPLPLILVKMPAS